MESTATAAMDPEQEAAAAQNVEPDGLSNIRILVIQPCPDSADIPAALPPEASAISDADHGSESLPLPHEGSHDNQVSLDTDQSLVFTNARESSAVGTDECAGAGVSLLHTLTDHWRGAGGSLDNDPDVEVTGMSQATNNDVVVTGIVSPVAAKDLWENVDSLVCPYCQHRAASTSELLCHGVEHENYVCKQSVPIHKTKLSYQDKHYECQTCELVTRSRLFFREHVRHHVLNTPYECVQCHFNAVSIADFLKHSQDTTANVCPQPILRVRKSQLVNSVISRLGPSAPAADEVFTVKKDDVAVSGGRGGGVVVSKVTSLTRASSRQPRAAEPPTAASEGGSEGDPILIDEDTQDKSKYKIRLEQVEDALRVKLLWNAASGLAEMATFSFKAIPATRPDQESTFLCVTCGFTTGGMGLFRPHIHAELHDMFHANVDVCPSCKNPKSVAERLLDCKLGKVIELILTEKMKKVSRTGTNAMASSASVPESLDTMQPLIDTSESSPQPEPRHPNENTNRDVQAEAREDDLVVIDPDHADADVASDEPQLAPIQNITGNANAAGNFHALRDIIQHPPATHTLNLMSATPVFVPGTRNRSVSPVQGKTRVTKSPLKKVSKDDIRLNIKYKHHRATANKKRFFLGKFAYENGYYSCLKCKFRSLSERHFKIHCSLHVHGKRNQCHHCPEGVVYNKLAHCPVLLGLMDMIKRASRYHNEWSVRVEESPGPADQASTEVLDATTTNGLCDGDNGKQANDTTPESCATGDGLATDNNAPQDTASKEPPTSLDQGLLSGADDPAEASTGGLPQGTGEENGDVLPRVVSVETLQSEDNGDPERFLDAGEGSGRAIPEASSPDTGDTEAIRCSRFKPYSGRNTQPGAPRSPPEEPAPPTTEGQSYLLRCAFPDCTFRTVEGTSFKLHNMTSHHAETNFPCESCSRGFPSADLLLTHHDIHKGLVYKCPMPQCSFGCRRGEDYGSHLSDSHGGLPRYSCCFCDKTARDVEDVVSHAALHVRTLIKCPYCGVTSPDKKDVQRHIAGEHPNMPKKIVISTQIVPDLEELSVFLGDRGNDSDMPENVPHSHNRDTPARETSADPEQRPPSVALTVSSEASTALADSVDFVAQQAEKRVEQTASDNRQGAAGPPSPVELPNEGILAAPHSREYLPDGPSSPDFAGGLAGADYNDDDDDDDDDDENDNGGVDEDHNDIGEAEVDEKDDEEELDEPIQQVELLQCEHCTFLSPNEETSVAHQQCHQSPQDRTNNFTCRMCPFSVDDAELFRIHLQLHPGLHKLRRYICAHCEYSTTQMSMMEDHLGDIHADLDFKFEVSQETLEHLQLMEPCRVCSMQIPKAPAELMAQHILLAHPKKPEKPKKPKEKVPNSSMKKTLSKAANAKAAADGSVQIDSFHCDMCMFSTFNGTLLRDHYSTEHGVSLPEGALDENEDAAVEVAAEISATSEVTANQGSFGFKMLSCHLCNFKTSKRKLHMKHMRTHGVEVPNAFKCSICPYSTTHAKNLRKHDLVHERVLESGFRCGYCKFASRQKSRVTCHINAYHPGKPKHVLDVINPVKTAQTSRKSTTKPARTPAPAPVDTDARGGASKGGKGVGTDDHVNYKPMSSVSSEYEAPYATTTATGSTRMENVPSLPSALCNVSLEEFEMNLPNMMVFRTPMQCPRCEFQTKARINLVRHLKLHSSRMDRSSHQADKDRGPDGGIQVSAPVPTPARDTDRDGASSQASEPETLKYCMKNPKSGLYQCVKCAFQHSTVGDVDAHYKTDHATYRCDVCQHKAKNLGLIREHAVMAHDEETVAVWRCFDDGEEELVEETPADKDDSGVYEREIETGDESCSFDDPVTSAMSPDQRRATMKHIDELGIAGMLKYNCKLCNYTSDHVHLVRRHVLCVHFKFNRFLCKYCPVGKAEVGVMRTHVLQNHGHLPQVYIRKHFDPTKHAVVQNKDKSNASSPYTGIASPGSAYSTASSSFRAATPTRSPAHSASSLSMSSPAPTRPHPPVQVKQEQIQEDFALAVALSESSQTRRRVEPRERRGSSSSSFTESSSMLPSREEPSSSPGSAKGKKKFGCAYCDYMSFYGKGDVQRHIFKVHMKMSTYTCAHPLCSFSSMSKGTMLNHQRQKHTTKKFTDDKDNMEKITHIHTENGMFIFGLPEGMLSQIQERKRLQKSSAGAPNASKGAASGSGAGDQLKSGPSTTRAFACFYCEFATSHNKRDVGRHILKAHLNLDVFLCGHPGCNFRSMVKTRMMDHQQLRHHKPIFRDMMKSMDQIVVRGTENGLSLFGFPETNDYDTQIQADLGPDRPPIKRDPVPLISSRARKKAKAAQRKDGAEKADAPEDDDEEQDEVDVEGTDEADDDNGEEDEEQDEEEKELAEPKLEESSPVASTTKSPRKSAGSSRASMPLDNKSGPKMSMYMCEYCNYSTKYGRTDVKKHILHAHLKMKSYSCGLCDFDAWHPPLIEDHHKKMHPGKEAKMIFTVKRIEHMMVPKKIIEPDRLVLGISPDYEANQLGKKTLFQCKICHIEGTNVSKIKWHVIIKHWKKKPYCCPVCPADYFIRGDCHRHIRSEHPGCQQETRSLMAEKAEELQQRIKKFVLFSGVRSGISKMAQEGVFDSISSPDRSAPEASPTKKLGSISSSKDKYSCDVCLFTTDKQDYFEAHMLTHSVYKCTYCSHEAVTKAALQIHCLEVHRDLPVKVKMTVPSGLRTTEQHSPSTTTSRKRSSVSPVGDDTSVKRRKQSSSGPGVTTSGESRKMQTGGIDMTFKSKNFGPNERSIASAESLLACHYCHFRCTGLTSMRNHVMRHLKYFPYSCPYCNACKSVRNFSIKRHVQVNHPGKECGNTLKAIPKMEQKVRQGFYKISNTAVETSTGRASAAAKAPDHPSPSTSSVKGTKRTKKTKPPAPALKSPEKSAAKWQPGEPLKYVCPLCGVKCSSLATLRRHIMRDMECKPYSCGVCGYADIVETFVRVHFTTKHPTMDPKEYSCIMKPNHSKLAQVQQLVRQAKKSREALAATLGQNEGGELDPQTSSCADEDPDLQPVGSPLSVASSATESSTSLGKWKKPKGGAVGRTPQEPANAFYCSDCDFVTARQAWLLSHIGKNHGRLMWKCGYCDLMKPLRRHIWRHQRSRHAAKPTRIISLDPNAGDRNLAKSVKAKPTSAATTTAIAATATGRGTRNKLAVAFPFKSRAMKKKRETAAKPLASEPAARERGVTRMPAERKRVSSSNNSDDGLIDTVLEGHVVQLRLEREHDGCYHCDHCDYTTAHRRYFKMHCMRHQPPNWVCQHCDQQYSMLYRLRRHCKTCHPGAPFAWRNVESGESGVSAADQGRSSTSGDPVRLSAVRQAKPKYCCDKCQFSSVSVNELLRHVQERHQHSSRGDVTGTGSGARGGRVTVKLENADHSATGSGGVGASTGSGGVAGWEFRTLKCGFCSFVTILQEELTEHVKTHTLCKPFKCPHCVFTGFYRSEVLRHCTRRHPERSPRALRIPQPDLGAAHQNEADDDASSTKSSDVTAERRSRVLRRPLRRARSYVHGLQVMVKVKDVALMSSAELEKLLVRHNVHCSNL